MKNKDTVLLEAAYEQVTAQTPGVNPQNNPKADLYNNKRVLNQVISKLLNSGFKAMNSGTGHLLKDGNSIYFYTHKDGPDIAIVTRDGAFVGGSTMNSGENTEIYRNLGPEVTIKSLEPYIGGQLRGATELLQTIDSHIGGAPSKHHL
jgi:hypothetical protein